MAQVSEKARLAARVAQVLENGERVSRSMVSQVRLSSSSPGEAARMCSIRLFL